LMACSACSAESVRRCRLCREACYCSAACARADAPRHEKRHAARLIHLQTGIGPGGSLADCGELLDDRIYADRAYFCSSHLGAGADSGAESGSDDASSGSEFEWRCDHCHACFPDEAECTQHELRCARPAPSRGR
jgi:hypothetical protein